MTLESFGENVLLEGFDKQVCRSRTKVVISVEENEVQNFVRYGSERRIKLNHC